ncbi:hypothetical protein L1987_40972 [Smallanthus sonchifolius]|uniref:Uncharacterized protein n=1 Tax=Smallanthus sonchifolius TaxID=185202 RepID=A0ACB9GU42_9ASTR|nr:hypothetical protein L1987_40972 [Smallanthus sonchifolius]
MYLLAFPLFKPNDTTLSLSLKFYESEVQVRASGELLAILENERVVEQNDCRSVSIHANFLEHNSMSVNIAEKAASCISMDLAYVYEMVSYLFFAVVILRIKIGFKFDSIAVKQKDIVISSSK